MPPLAAWKKPVAVVVRAGEGAFAVAEELGLHQRFGNRAAVDRDEGFVGACAVRMDIARGQLLAAARLAGDGHRRHAAREARDLRAQILHRGRLAEQARTGLPPWRTAAPLAAAFLQTQCRLHHQAQLVQAHRLGEIVEGAGLERSDGVVGAAESGDDGNRGVRIAAAPRAPVRCPGRPASACRSGSVHSRSAPGSARACGKSVGTVDIEAHANERDFQQLAQVGLVVDDQNTRGMS